MAVNVVYSYAAVADSVFVHRLSSVCKNIHDEQGCAIAMLSNGRAQIYRSTGNPTRKHEHLQTFAHRNLHRRGPSWPVREVELAVWIMISFSGAAIGYGVKKLTYFASLAFNKPKWYSVACEKVNSNATSPS